MVPALIPIHGVWERDTTQLTWSQKEAYLLVGRLREGWSGNLWQAAWETVRGIAGLAGNRTDRRHWLEVTKITSVGTTLTVVPDTDASSFRVFEDQLYGTYHGSIAKWVDGEFMLIGADEGRPFERGSKGGDFRDVNGWSSETNLVNTTTQGERRYPLVLDGVRVEVIVNQGVDRRTVSVQFPSRARATILGLPNQTARVDAATYRRLFSPTTTP